MLSFLIARLSASLPCRRRTQLGFLHHNASQIFKSFASVVKLSESNQPKQKQEGNESFTVSYLKNSCSLSAKVAIEVSKRVHLKDLENPDSVLNLFRNYGFSETQISKLVRKFPSVLLARPEKTLLPKLRFFQSIGFSGSELPKVLSSNSRILASSLKRRIVPSYAVLKSVLEDDEKVCIAIKRSGWYFPFHSVENLVTNIKVLKEHGVPQSSVSPLFTNFISVAFMSNAKLVESIKFAKETGIEPFRITFIQAIYVFAATKKSTWESKLDTFKRCGWSRDVTLLAFRRYPYCMLMSEKKIINSMKFFLDEMCLPLEDIAACASLLGYSLKQRIIPRLSVVKVLQMKGMIKKDMSLVTIVILSERKFLEKFVIRFQAYVPDLLNIYKGQLGPLPGVQS